MAPTIDLKIMMSLQYSQVELAAAKAKAALGSIDKASMDVVKNGAKLSSSVGVLGHSLAGLNGIGGQVTGGIVKMSSALMMLESAAGSVGLAMGAAFIGIPLVIGEAIAAVEKFQNAQKAAKEGAAIASELLPWETRAREAAEAAQGSGYKQAMEDRRAAIAQIEKLRAKEAEILDSLRPGFMEFLGGAATGTGGMMQATKFAAVEAELTKIRTEIGRLKNINMPSLEISGYNASVEQGISLAMQSSTAYMTQTAAIEQLAEGVKDATERTKEMNEAYAAQMQLRASAAVSDKAFDQRTLEYIKGEYARGQAIAEMVDPSARMKREIQEIRDLVKGGFLEEGAATKRIRQLASGIPRTEGNAFVSGSAFYAAPTSKDGLAVNLLQELVEGNGTMVDRLNRIITKLGLAS